jgi:hypothetical protein
MQTNKAPRNLGDFVAASYDLGQAIGQDSSTAAELAAHRLERVLARSSNLRLSAALVRLARDLGPLRAAPLSLHDVLTATVAR